jgi:magnesium-transporting ATPase (P-type)
MASQEDQKQDLTSQLPADLRFVEVSSDLKLDRAVLTGESEPIQGTIGSTDPNMLETKNIGLQGTLCVSGSGMGERQSYRHLNFTYTQAWLY